MMFAYNHAGELISSFAREAVRTARGGYSVVRRYYAPREIAVPR